MSEVSIPVAATLHWVAFNWIGSSSNQLSEQCTDGKLDGLLENKSNETLGELLRPLDFSLPKLLRALY
jgi:hypothetical protein